MAEPDFSFLRPSQPDGGAEHPGRSPFSPPPSPFEPPSPFDVRSAASAAPLFAFSPQDHVLLSSLAFRMRVVGLVVALGGALVLIPATLSMASGGALGSIFLLVIATAFILYGVQTTGAAKAFRQIVDSRGNDQTHFMAAVDKLITVFTLHAVYLALVLIGLALLLAFFFFAVRAVRGF